MSLPLTMAVSTVMRHSRRLDETSCHSRGYLDNDGHCTCTVGPAAGLLLSFCHKMHHEHPQYDAQCCVRAGSPGAIAARAAASAEKMHVSLEIGRATDYGWVEVSRMRDDSGSEGMGYGCWLAHTPGSGMWINLGRTRVFPEGSLRVNTSRDAASTHFCSNAGPCARDPHRSASNWRQIASREKLCTAAGCPCDFCDPIFDTWWAVRAHLEGLDSFVHHHAGAYEHAAGRAVWGGHVSSGWEVTVTTEACLLAPRPLDVCVPLPLMVGIGMPRRRCELCVCAASTCRVWHGSPAGGGKVFSCDLMACAQPSHTNLTTSLELDESLRSLLPNTAPAADGEPTLELTLEPTRPPAPPPLHPPPKIYPPLPPLAPLMPCKAHAPWDEVALSRRHTAMLAFFDSELQPEPTFVDMMLRQRPKQLQPPPASKAAPEANAARAAAKKAPSPPQPPQPPQTQPLPQSEVQLLRDQVHVLTNTVADLKAQNTLLIHHYVHRGGGSDDAGDGLSSAGPPSASRLAPPPVVAVLSVLDLVLLGAAGVVLSILCVLTYLRRTRRGWRGVHSDSDAAFERIAMQEHVRGDEVRGDEVRGDGPR
jgi:hypothetical protein